jgi:hypothetical protein
MNDVPESPLDVKSDKIFELLRNELTYEANLIANRTSWFVAAQAFFFTALASALDRTPGVPFTFKNSLLFPLIPWVSLIVCVVIFISVLAAISSANKTRERIKGLTTSPPHVSEIFPRSKLVIIAGLLPSLILPLIFAICWLIILRG